MTSSVDRQFTLGPIKLSPGVTPREIYLFLLCNTTASIMASFCVILQPFIFTEVLHLPSDIQGRVGGMLSSLQELMFLLFISIAGILADRWGRKLMLLMALSGFAICGFLYPLVSSLTALIVVRMFFGLASNGLTAGGPPKMFDYPDNTSRGKFMALVIVVLNLSNIILVGALGSHMPAWFKQAGLSSVAAGRASFWIAAAIAAAVVPICAFGLARDRPIRPVSATSGGLKAIFSGFRQVYEHALSCPAFGLLMITGFVIRSDTLVLQSFISLWVVTAGHAAGIATTDALKIVGALAVLRSTCSVVVPPVFGLLLDRFNRQYLYIFAMGFSGLALISTTFVHDVSSWPLFVTYGVLGLSESALGITQNALFGESAPVHLRGTAYGVFACTGTVSVVIITAIGGVLFDRIGYTAPFALAGALHIIFLAIALIFMAVRKGRSSPPAPAVS